MRFKSLQKEATLSRPPRKSRIAPTPSGYLHEGNLANFMAAAHLAGPEGDLLLRIDDLDRGRYRPEYVADVFRQLNRLDIQPTEGPRDLLNFESDWSQTLRLERYQLALDSLKESPQIFACACSRKELAGGTHQHGCLAGELKLDAPGVTWRINTRSLPEKIFIPDLVADKPFIVHLHESMPDFAVRRKNGRPSYQLACTVDDLDFGITHIARGQDLLASTAAQSVLSELLGYQSLFKRVCFLHHPLLIGEGNEKLSKSAGAQSEPHHLSGAEVDRLRVIVEGWFTR